MEAKKSMKIVAFLTVGAVVVFLAVLFLNSHIESKKDNRQAAAELGLQPENQQSFAVANLPIKNEADFVVGPGGKELNVIVYEDYADAFSAEFATILDRAKGEFGEKVNFVYRPFNVSSSDLSSATAQAVLCAAESNQGENYRAKAYVALQAGELSLEKLGLLAENCGLNKEEFAACLTNTQKKEKIEELASDAENFSVTGAPTVFIGDEMIVGARPYDTFTDSNGDEIEGLKQVIERQLK